MLAPSATLCFSLKIHQKAFEKDSRNKNTIKTQRHRGHKEGGKFKKTP
jgi:hypothetical protein